MEHITNEVQEKRLLTDFCYLCIPILEALGGSMMAELNKLEGFNAKSSKYDLLS